MTLTDHEGKGVPHMKKSLGVCLCAAVLCGLMGPAVAAAGGQTLHTAYFTGYKDGAFHPDDSLTRGQCAAILARLSGGYEPETDYRTDAFSDVTGEQWFSNFVGFTYLTGFINGYPDGAFYPDKPITRAEFAAAVCKALGLSGEGQASYPDVQTHWAKSYIGMLSDRGILGGYPSGAFRPDAPISRAEAAKVLNAAFDRAPDPDKLQAHPKPEFTDVTDRHWAYYQIWEATTEHEAEEFHTIVP